MVRMRFAHVEHAPLAALVFVLCRPPSLWIRAAEGREDFRADISALRRAATFCSSVRDLAEGSDSGTKWLWLGRWQVAGDELAVLAAAEERWWTLRFLTDSK